MTPDDIANLRRLLAGASPGPWRECGRDRGGCQCCMVWSEPGSQYIAQAIKNDPDIPSPSLEIAKANAKLIAAAVNALPALLDEVERLRAENAELRAALRSTLTKLEAAHSLLDDELGALDEDDARETDELIISARALLEGQ